MFIRSTRLPFGADALPAPSAAFAEMRAAIFSHVRGDDVELLTEVLWAALHGLVMLDRGARLRPEYRDARRDLIVRRIVVETLGES